jgi:hypothetical protein
VGVAVFGRRRPENVGINHKMGSAWFRTSTKQLSFLDALGRSLLFNCMVEYKQLNPDAVFSALARKS